MKEALVLNSSHYGERSARFEHVPQTKTILEGDILDICSLYKKQNNVIGY